MYLHNQHLHLKLICLKVKAVCRMRRPLNSKDRSPCRLTSTILSVIYTASFLCHLSSSTHGMFHFTMWQNSMAIKNRRKVLEEGGVRMACSSQKSSNAGTCCPSPVTHCCSYGVFLFLSRRGEFYLFITGLPCNWPFSFHRFRSFPLEIISLPLEGRHGTITYLVVIEPHSPRCCAV